MSMKNQRGFSLVELLITMVIFLFVIVAASSMFLGILNQFKQQSKIAETNIEGIAGLQMLKADIEQAGYGLPYDVNGATYAEALGGDAGTVGFNATTYNDSGAPGNAPRALLAGNSLTMTNTSDVLVVKATNIAINDTAQKWGYVTHTGVTTWTNAAGTAVTDENFLSTDRVTVVMPQSGTNLKILQVSGGAFYTTFNNIASSDFSPSAANEPFLVYGIAPNGITPIMPFNRSDYYVRTPGTMPTHCAPGTGILYKGTINHTAGGGNHSELPLLDCVAAMKVILAADTSDDNISSADSFPSIWNVGTTAADIRNQLKEVRVYILLHEGQRDTSYTSPAQMQIWDRDHDVVTPILTYNVPDRNYRWKIYTLVITPYNLR